MRIVMSIAKKQNFYKTGSRHVQARGFPGQSEGCSHCRMGAAAAAISQMVSDISHTCPLADYSWSNSSVPLQPLWHLANQLLLIRCRKKDEPIPQQEVQIEGNKMIKNFQTLKTQPTNIRLQTHMQYESGAALFQHDAETYHF